MSNFGLSSLKELFSKADGPEGFEHLPTTLEKILQSLDSRELHPNFRADIYELLLGATTISSKLSEQTYDGTEVAVSCARLHEVLARIVVHLTKRPTSRAFGILFTRTSTLHEDICASEEEAGAKLEGLRRIGLRENGEVVQVTITSAKLAQPKALPRSEQTIEDLTKQIESASK